VPPQAYIDLYDRIDVDKPYKSDWSQADTLPFPIQALKARHNLYTEEQFMEAKRAFYALCTQIDHQIRYLVGTLRLEGILDNTIVMFTSDHGDMLGNHGMLAKRVFYESSANIPMILMPNKGNPRVAEGAVDDRLVAFADVMPTLLDLAGVDIPDTVDGQSMVAGEREYIYGECGEDDHATRMIREDHWKLIWYPTGNHFHLFDIKNDPHEMSDLASDTQHADILQRLQKRLKEELYGGDLEWIDSGSFKGQPDRPYHWAPHRSLNSQRGDGWPPGPVVDIPQIEWTKERTTES